MGNILRFLLGSWCKNPGTKPEEFPRYQEELKAARQGDVEMLQELTRATNTFNGLESLPNIVDHLTGKTLLHAAMEKGNKDCVQFLIKAGCDLTKGDHSGETPIHVACMNDSVGGLAAALEVAKEVSLDITDMWQRTPLLKAMIYNSERIVQFLLSLSVNLDAQDIYGLSVLHVAVTYNQLDLIREVVARGANLNPLTNSGRSPLTMAIIALNPNMVKELLMLGASTSCAKFKLPVVLAISGLIHHSEEGAVCQRSEEILHLMLAAHGLPLHSDEPSVFQHVLYTTDTERFLPLLHKLLVCSDSVYDDLKARLCSSEQSGRNRGGPRLHTAVNLFDLARRSARKALMASGHNVLWAVERLNSSVPPAVKGALMLKDCDLKDFPFQR